MTLGERIVRNDEVVGCDPVSSTKFFKHFRKEGVSPISCCVVVCVVTPSSTPGIRPPHSRLAPRGNRRGTRGKVVS